MFYLSVPWAYSNHDCMQRKTAALLKLLHKVFIPLKLNTSGHSRLWTLYMSLCYMPNNTSLALMHCSVPAYFTCLTQLFHLSMLNHMVFVHYITAGLFLCAGLLRNWLFSFSSKFPILIFCLSNRPEEWHRYLHLIVAKKEKKEHIIQYVTVFL